MESVLPVPEPEPSRRSCTHPGSAVGFRPCWRHQLTQQVCLCPCGWFWSDCKSFNSASKTVQVLKRASLSRRSPSCLLRSAFLPSVGPTLGPCQNVTELRPPSLSAQLGPNNMTNKGLNLWETQVLWAVINTVTHNVYVRQSDSHPLTRCHVYTSWQLRPYYCSSLY